MLFIDEAYSLAPNTSHHDYGHVAIDALVKRMEDQRGDFAIVIAGYTDEMQRFLGANPGVKSRFNRYFYFEHYKPQELFDIFEKFCLDTGYILSDEAAQKVQTYLNRACLRRSKTFGNGRLARNWLEKIIERQANRVVDIDPITDEALSTITEADIPELKPY